MHLGYLFGADTYSDNRKYVPTSLKTVVVTGGDYIGYGAFSNCQSLKSVTIRDGVTVIGGAAFEQCYALTEISLPDSVTSIGTSAFSGCHNLRSFTIGPNVKEIGQRAFFDCYRMVEVYNRSQLTITAGSTDYGEVGYDAKVIYTAPYTSRVSVDQNGYVLYRDGATVSLIAYEGTETDLVLPSGITEINSCALLGLTTLKSVVIPEGVTSIGDYAFQNCKLESVTIPVSVIKIGTYSFYLSSNDFTYNGTQAQWKAIIKGTSWLGSSNYIIHCMDGDIGTRW